MILDSSTARRLGVFFFFDAQGVADRYVEVMLTDMVKNLTELVIVVNGKLTAASRTKFERFTNNIIVRENQGFDAWAYRTALKSYGWEKLAEFDEVVLFNATIMGPVYPFAEMFTEMADRDIDFWGITWFHKFPFDPFGTTPEGYLPRHLQSHFHVYRRSLVTSRAFQDYWDNLPMLNSYFDSVGKHEAPFTQRFERLGFKSDVYCNTEDIADFTYQPILFAPRLMIEEKRCPIFKRRSFFHNYDDVLDQSVGRATPELYAYLRDHTDFDTDLIWENALRTMNMADLVENLNLNYVLPAQAVIKPPAPQKIALIVHVYYLDLLEETLDCVKLMPADADVYVTTSSKEVAEAAENLLKNYPQRSRVMQIPNRGRDVSALLVASRDFIFDYDLICFIHDKKVKQLDPGTKGAGFATKVFENLLPSAEFVENVIALFEREKRLGMACPTPPTHAEYFPVYTFGWSLNFEITKQLLEKMGLEIPLDEKKPPITPLGTMFWARPAALRPLFEQNWDYSDFPPEPNNIDGTVLHAIERAYGYTAQGAGYYVAWLHSDRFVRTELTNLSFYLRDLTRGVCLHQQRNTFVRMMNDLHHPKRARFHAKAWLRRVIPSSLHAPLRRAYGRIRGLIRR